MVVKKISFKNMVKDSTYFAIGGIRFYDDTDTLIPILFSTQNQSLTNHFTGGLTGTVDTANSYGSYYYVDSPFDTSKSQNGSTSEKNYWLSSTANEISITFDVELDTISRIEYVPKPDDGYGNRYLNSLTIELTGSDGEIIFSENINTASFAIDTVYSVDVSDYILMKRILLKSNNKVYSLKSNEQKYDLKMTSNSTPAPYVASASNVVSTSNSAWRAFDGIKTNINGGWMTSSGIREGWIQIDFGSIKSVNYVELMNLPAQVFIPKDFIIEASKDGSVFETILSVKDYDAKISEVRILKTKRVDARYFRIVIVSNYGGNRTGFVNIEFSYRNKTIDVLPNNSIANFINYGTSSIGGFNGVFSNKNYILQDTVSENADGLWVQELDRKPLSIKFE